MSDIRIPLLPQREGSFQTTGAMRHLHDAHTLEDRIGGGTDGSVCRGIARNGPEGEAHAIGAIPRRPHRAATPIGAIPPRRPQPAVILNPRPPSYPPTRDQRDMQAMEEHTRRAARAIASGGFMRASPYSVTRSLDEIIADHGECEVQPRAATPSRRSRRPVGDIHRAFHRNPPAEIVCEVQPRAATPSRRSRSPRRRRPTQNRGPISLPARLLRGAAASRSEVGSSWHFGGLRTWLWMHDGIQVNGWIQLGARGVLHHGFSCRNAECEARWRPGDHPSQLILSFGRCHHYCELVYGSMTCVNPMFEVIDREMIDDGRFCESRSMGELLLEDEPSCRNAEC